MISTSMTKLTLTSQTTTVGTEKMDDLALETYGIVTTEFSVYDKLSKARFFEETFLLAHTSIEVVLGMPFLSLSNANL